MAQEKNGFGCKEWCWVLALLAGLIAAIVMHRPMHWLLAILIGAVVCAALGWVLTRFFCSQAAEMSHAPVQSQSAPAPKAAAAQPAQVATQATAAPVAKPAAPVTAVAAVAATAAAAAVIRPSATLKGQDELASQKGDWKYEGTAPAKAAPKAATPAAAKAAAPKAAKPAVAKAAAPKAAKPAAAKAAAPKAAKTAAAKAAAPKAATPAAAKAAAPKAAKVAAPKAATPAAAKAAAPKAAKPAVAKTAAPKAAKPAAKAPAAAKPAAFAAITDAAIAAAGAGKKPKGITQARRGKADDLKIIEGIGPALETFCNSLGVFHYDQIATWGPADVAWMDQNTPRFKGRISRDKWVAQARLIGEVGIPEFLIRAKTNNY